ncbi:hypothetical protein [Actinophytocola xanthii]|uniref:Lipoprotein n=1 Tax=Actinophytocola xanthii TaxID=1912961 RepID=A0A1Q8CX90_9PSEU|nr:hypothetical protein [Actinophytocola xanthii]OLF18971.1 hypothetical protein BU204_03690 [Actinophytocola xanthii]
MGSRWCLVPVTALLVAAGCASSGPASEFCTGYDDTMHELVLAARDYSVAPEEFRSRLATAKSTVARMRAEAPDDRLRSALETASFTFTVFGSDEHLADFLTRADFSDNAMVLACAEYGVEIRPGAG